jgi:hypothetical protein
VYLTHFSFSCGGAVGGGSGGSFGVAEKVGVLGGPLKKRNDNI